jgi:hypothetical protein
MKEQQAMSVDPEQRTVTDPGVANVASTRVPEDVLAEQDAEVQRTGHEPPEQLEAEPEDIPDDVRAERDADARAAEDEVTLVPTDDRVVAQWNQPEVACDR